MTSTISDNSPALLLRPHHLLCIQNYRGRGYSAGFHEKMSAVISKLKSSDGTAVKLIDGADDLCMACPHLQDGSCHVKGVAGRMLPRLFLAGALHEDSLRIMRTAAGVHLSIPGIPKRRSPAAVCDSNFKKSTQQRAWCQ